ncbi:MAG: hypothetical protein RLZZ229_756 [Actinomycetota bacterium]|jgi:hypothetical protein
MAKQSNPKGKPAPKTGIARVENILAFMVAGFLISSVLAVIATFVYAATGAETPTVGQTTFTPTMAVVALYPNIGLPAAALSIIALLIVSARRRAKENK